MRRILGTLVVLAAIVVGVGIWRDWFHFRSQSSTNDDQTTTFSVDVNRQKIQDDKAAAAESARQLGERIQEGAQGIASGHSARGHIAKVGPMDNRVLVVKTSDDKELTLQLEPTTKIFGNEQAMQYQDLHEGEHIWVTYSIQDGKNIARSITILPAA
ncbi:MAG TPA: hypothetical protein VGZ47_08530 [Gemmataceae bacterium]|nr:hypothetical protein [Gemmataceae bacterium]